MTLALAVVLANAHVLTMNPERPRASVIATLDERIVYVGDDLPAARKAAGPKAEIIDAGGRTVVPGFNDAHVHFGLSLTLGGDHGVDIPSLGKRAWQGAVKKASSARPDGDWLFVKTRNLPEGIARASDLDFVQRPLFVVTARGGLVNRAGVRKAGFSAAQAPRGFIRGRELAAALDHVVRSLPIGRLRAGARAFLARCARLGITSAQLISEELPELFEELRKEGALTCRIRMVPLGYRHDNRLYQPEWQAPAPDWVRVDGVKYFHDDGARITRFELAEIFERSVAAQRRVVVHVLSRHALDTLLDGLELNGRQTGKPDGVRLFRVDHADEVTPEQARRLQRLGLVVCANPSMLPEWHTDRAFPLRTLKEGGVRTCIGSDWVGTHLPDRPLAPLASVALAVSHGGYGDAERISAAEALDAYTAGSAAAEGQAHSKGDLQPGKLADLVVLSADPTAAQPDEIARIEPFLTMVGGRIVYRASR